MADLIAQGSEPPQRWRRTLPPGVAVVLGRSGPFAATWDAKISRNHAELCATGDALDVRKLSKAANPIFVRGTEAEQFSIGPREHFVIGETTFTLADDRANVSIDDPLPDEQKAYSADYLKRLRFSDPDRRIDVLSRLPELISSASSDAELFARVINVVMTGIPRATAAALVQVMPVESSGGGGSPKVEVLHWDRRRLSDRDFNASERLIVEAVKRGESVLHRWKGASQVAYTAADEADWAFCTPLSRPTSEGWAIYVSGRTVTETDDTVAAGQLMDLRDELKFTELVAASLDSLRELRSLERRQAGLRQFFAPVVLDALANRDPFEVLAPREANVSVMFCDLRGFARRSERESEGLLELLNRVSQALGVATRQILDAGGVVGDFQGDAVMGFWGWPLEDEDTPLAACRAALGIQSELEAAHRREGHPLGDFQMGIGIATGRAVAGKIGTADHVKVTVFGPVVNLASRLEGMTKTLRAPILLDPATTAAVRERIPPDIARVRRLAIVRPFGLEKSLEVGELLPPVSAFGLLTDEHIKDFEDAVAALVAGDWDTAFELLHRVPAEDRAKDFLTVLIAQHNRTPPEDWDGVIRLSSK